MKIQADLDCVEGYLRCGHIEFNIKDKKEQEEFKNMSRSEQEEYLINSGEVVVDDYELNSYGNIRNIKIEED